MTEGGQEGRAEHAPASEVAPDNSQRIDSFVGVLDDPEEIRRRGKAMTSEEEETYLAGMAPHYVDQAEEEEAAWREAGVDVDGTGEGLPPDAVPRSEVPYRGPGGARVRVPAGRQPVRPAPEASPVPDKSDVVNEPRAPSSPAGKREVPGGGVWPGEESGEEAMERLIQVQVTGMGTLARAIEQGIQELKAAMPAVGGEQLAGLAENVSKLEELLRLQKSDEGRRREAGGDRWRWPLRAAVAVVVVAALAGGAVLQSKWPVIPDETNGWKHIVWKRHGMKVAECIDTAAKRGKGAVCEVNAVVR